MSRHSRHQARSPATGIQKTERARLGNKWGEKGGGKKGEETRKKERTLACWNAEEAVWICSSFHAWLCFLEYDQCVRNKGKKKCLGAVGVGTVQHKPQHAQGISKDRLIKIPTTPVKTMDPSKQRRANWLAWWKTSWSIETDFFVLFCFSNTRQEPLLGLCARNYQNNHSDCRRRLGALRVRGQHVSRHKASN